MRWNLEDTEIVVGIIASISAIIISWKQLIKHYVAKQLLRGKDKLSTAIKTNHERGLKVWMNQLFDDLGIVDRLTIFFIKKNGTDTLVHYLEANNNARSLKDWDGIKLENLPRFKRFLDSKDRALIMHELESFRASYPRYISRLLNTGIKGMYVFKIRSDIFIQMSVLDDDKVLSEDDINEIQIRIGQVEDILKLLK